MAITANRLKYGQNPDYVDERMSANSLEELLRQSSDEHFKGQTVTVKQLSEELAYSADLWYCGGTSKSALQLKSLPEIKSMDDLKAITAALTIAMGESSASLIKDGFRATCGGKEYVYNSANAENPWEEAENFSSTAFLMTVPTEETEAGKNPIITLKYDGSEVATADLSTILSAWDSDDYITGGTLSETEATGEAPLKTEIKLSYHDETKDAIAVDVSSLVMMIDGDNVQK